MNISERTATAMLYAIKSDTLFFARQTNRVDLEAFSFLYPLADAALIRKMEGAEITLERLEYINRASRSGVLRDQVFSAFVGEAEREDFIPYTADFFLLLWKFEKPGFGTVLRITDALIDRVDLSPGELYRGFVTLDKVGSVPAGMVRVSPERYIDTLQIPGYEGMPELKLKDYWIDRYEVSNRQFKTFVDQGG